MQRRLHAKAIPLKRQRPRQIFRQQILVKGLHVGELRAVRILGIQIVRIKALHPRLHLVILRVAQVLVLILAVPRIEAVKADHVQRGHWQIRLQHVIQIFIMTPTHMNLLKAAFLAVNAQFRLQFRAL